MEHVTTRGRLLYTSKKPELMDHVRGGETYIITSHVDGRRTLRSHCAIDENSPRVLRDSITSYDADWKPTDAFVRLTIDEKFLGSSWFHFSETEAVCEGFTEQEGRISQRMALTERPSMFATHPLQADAYMMQAYDLSKGPGQMIIGGMLCSSMGHRGETGPYLMKINQVDIPLVFLGQETVTVKAGTFEALHFRLSECTDDDYMGRDTHPPYHLWTTADGEYIMLKASVTGYMQTYYELVEFDRRPNFF